MSPRYIEFIQDVLITIHSNIRDLRERRNFAGAEELTYIEAKILTYTEVLAILQFSADEYGLDRKEIGL
jgi:hypothetical protein